jgi:hypothetical protein
LVFVQIRVALYDQSQERGVRQILDIIFHATFLKDRP